MQELSFKALKEYLKMLIEISKLNSQEQGASEDQKYYQFYVTLLEKTEEVDEAFQNLSDDRKKRVNQELGNWMLMRLFSGNPTSTT